MIPDFFHIFSLTSLVKIIRKFVVFFESGSFAILKTFMQSYIFMI